MPAKALYFRLTSQSIIYLIWDDYECDRIRTMSTAAKTPEKILDSAQTLMLNEGYHGVSVDSIIERSGVSKGTFFYHFKSKEVLAEKLLVRFFQYRSDKITQLMQSKFEEFESPLDAMLSFIDSLAPLYRATSSEQGCLMAAFSYQLLDEMPHLREICQDQIDGWQTFFLPYFVKALNCSEQAAIELSRMMFCQLEGGFVVERIDHSHELEAQFKHLRRYIQLLADAHTR